MKVCLLGNAGSVHIQRLVPGLARRGVEVTVVTRKPVAIEGATVERFDVPPPGVTNPRRWASRLTHYLSGFARRFDVVNVHFLSDWGLTPSIMEQGCFVVSPWGSDIVPAPGEGRADASLIEKRRDLLRSAAGVTAWGPSFARTIAEFAGVPVGGIDLLPLGVDLAQFDVETYPRDRRAADAPRVGFYKGFRPVYGAVHLIEAIPLVLGRDSRIRFDLVGDGFDLALCHVRATELGIGEAIRWLPRQPHEAIPGWLAQWDLSVIPSLCESFGAAALESSAMGVPVVASDVGGLPDTVRDGLTGRLVPPGDPAALGQAIVELLQDESARRHMGEAGRAWVRAEFDWEQILDRWVETYERVCDRSPVSA